ncbi:MAG: hypothetical protein K2J77_12010 [Oscillospiraceae bacterium]|nr:hypothetical protein [Oscillospiraceae bacterium]
MKKIIVIGLGIIFCAILAILIATPVVNDNVAKKTAKELSDLQLPQNTEHIETVSKAGKLDGNGNGMQYFGAILIKSELPLNELEDYYLSKIQCEVRKQTTSEIAIIQHRDLAFKTEINGDNFYIVYSWVTNSGLFHELDIRGRY